MISSALYPFPGMVQIPSIDFSPLESWTRKLRLGQMYGKRPASLKYGYDVDFCQDHARKSVLQRALIFGNRQVLGKHLGVLGGSVCCVVSFATDRIFMFDQDK